MFIKATVTSFDTSTKMSKCRGEGSGNTYVDVGFGRAIGDDTSTPKPGDRVLLWEDSGQYWILLKLDRVSLKEEKAFIPDISPSGDTAVSLLETTSLDQTLAIARTHVEGHIPGDKVLAARGGSILAALMGGVILARVSAFCSIMLSKADDILKIFVRNLEKHSSASSTVESCRGTSSYTYTEYYLNQANAFTDTPSVVECLGNVAYGLTYKLDFRGSQAAPATDGRVYYLSVPGVYTKAITSTGVVTESIQEEYALSTVAGTNSLTMNASGTVMSSDIKIRLEVGDTSVELTPTKLRLLSDLISENGA